MSSQSCWVVGGVGPGDTESQGCLPPCENPCLDPRFLTGRTLHGGRPLEGRVARGGAWPSQPLGHRAL